MTVISGKTMQLYEVCLCDVYLWSTWNVSVTKVVREIFVLYCDRDCFCSCVTDCMIFQAFLPAESALVIQET